MPRSLLLLLTLPLASTLRLGSAPKMCSSESSANVPAVIIGGGRIGSLLQELGCDGAEMDSELGCDAVNADIVLKRGEVFPASAPVGPIYVCTRNDALDAIVDSTPADRREDLVFLQNGMLGGFLESKGLAENTQVLLYLAVAKMGEAPIDGITTVNPEGLTSATGKWAEAFKARLEGGGLTCNVRDGDDFKRAMLEKHVWICAFMLCGALHGGITVGEVESEHSAELRSLIDELGAAGEKELGVTLAPGVYERLSAYGRSVAHFPTAVKEFEWRNGWFHKISERALAKGEADPMPIHTAGLQKMGVVA